MSKSFADVMASKKNGRRRVTHTLLMSPDLSDEYRELNERLLEAVGRRKPVDSDAKSTRRMSEKDEATEIAEQMATLVEANPDATYEVTLEQQRRADWLKLRNAHPPRDKVPMDGGLFNYETFPPEAVRLSLVDPEPTDEIMEYLEEVLSNGEWEAITMKIWQLNEGMRDTPKSVLASSILATSATE